MRDKGISLMACFVLILACVSVTFLAIAQAVNAGVHVQPLSDINPDDVSWIGKTIFQNECGGKQENLIAWNRGEDFPSLGIGHFIWYPKGKEGPFEESFPAYLDYARKSGVRLPNFIRSMKDVDCPWPSRREFMNSRNTPSMKQLHAFLMSTTREQTLFIVARLQKAIPRLLEAATDEKKQHVGRQLERISGSSRQLFALIDYVNFKGEGLKPSERYNNQGWGLLQVLEEMEGVEPGPLAIHDFIQAAEVVLTRRVANAPFWRSEHRWLSGWINRIGYYRRLTSLT